MGTTKKTTDDKVRELFDKVQAKKLEIEKAEKPCWTTSCQFGYSANSAHDRVNIQTITDLRKLVDILAFLKEREDKTSVAAKELGVEHEFTWLGFSVDEWKEDLLIRLNQISLQEKRKQLSNLETRLNSIISPELRAQMELESISKLLDD